MNKWAKTVTDDGWVYSFAKYLSSLFSWISESNLIDDGWVYSFAKNLTFSILMNKWARTVIDDGWVYSSAKTLPSLFL